MLNGIDRFASAPSNIALFDGFNEPTLSDIWNTPVEYGTLITIGSGVVNFDCAAGGSTDASILEFSRGFGCQTSFEADVQVTTTPLKSLLCGIRLYRDSDNWVQIGPYIGTGGGTSYAVLLSYSIAGTPGSEILRNIGVDDIVRKFRLSVLENHVIAYSDGIKKFDIEFNDPGATFVDYKFQLVAGSLVNTDILSVEFSNIKVQNGFIEPLPSPVRFKGNLVLASTTPEVLTFAKADHGEMFELVLAANLDEAYMPYAYMYDASVGYSSIVNVCNNLVSNSVPLLPAVPAANDGAFFGAAQKFWCIDVYMEGSLSPNTDNAFSINYWNGAAWAAIPGVVDGSNGGTAGRTFAESGRIYFSPPADWAQNAVNGVTAYWVYIKVTFAGASIPTATHIQLGFNASTGFDHNAAFLSTLMVKLKRNFPSAGYPRFYNDAMPYRQCVGERNVDINGLRADGDIRASFELSDTPSRTVQIEYFGFTRRM